MVDNDVVIKLVEEAWREKAVTPADRKFEGVSKPGRKRFYGRTDDEESGIGSIPGLSYKLARVENEAYEYKHAVPGGDGGDDDSGEEVAPPFKDGDIVIDVFFYECRPDCHPFAAGLRLDVSRAVTILRDVITVVTSVVEHGICEWDDESYSVDTEEHACVQVALNLDGDD